MALTATIPLLWPEPVRRDGRVAYPAFMALSVTTLCYGVVNAARTALRSRGTA